MAKKRNSRAKSRTVSGKKRKSSPSVSRSAVIWVRVAFVIIVVLVLWKPLKVGRLFSGPDTKTAVAQNQAVAASQQMSVTFSFNGIKTVRGYSGWSPKNDSNPARNRSIMGNPLTVKEKVFQRGLGTHAPSEIVFGLNAEVKKFSCLAGVDSDAGSSGNLIFTVKVDGKQAYESPALTREDKPVSIEVNTAGAKELSLIVNGVKTHSWGHGDWLDLTFEK
jgi:endo-alpha-N-acetylgalactosaminidase